MAQAEICGLSFIDEAQMTERVAEMDANNDGSVSFVEYETFLATLNFDAETRSGFVGQFTVMDANANGVLSPAELRTGIDTAAAVE